MCSMIFCNMTFPSATFFKMGTPRRTIMMLHLFSAARPNTNYFATMVTGFIEIFKSLLCMQSCMPVLRTNLKILNTIIQRIPIYVMYNFLWIQLSTKKFLHEMTMFKLLFSIYRYYLVTAVNATTSIISIFANEWISVFMPATIMFATQSTFAPISPVRRIFASRYSTNWSVHSIIVPVLFRITR